MIAVVYVPTPGCWCLSCQIMRLYAERAVSDE